MRGGEIVDARLCSHTLLDSATQMWLFINDCPPTGFNKCEKLTVTKYTRCVYMEHCNRFKSSIRENAPYKHLNQNKNAQTE